MAVIFTDAMTPDKEGWLWKKGAVRKNWKRRWFVLAFNAIAYFSSPQEVEPLGIIPLEDCVIEENGDQSTNYRFSFILFLTGGRDFCMRANSEDEVVDWLVACNHSIAQAKLAAKARRTKHQRRLWLQMLRKHFKELMAKPRVSIPITSPKTERKSNQNHTAFTVPVFGAPLEEVLKRDGLEYRIPYIARKAIEYLETNALQTEGLFRLSGDNEEILALRAALESGEDIDLFKVKDPHVVSCLLKLFVRELPEPLGRFELYERWLEASQIPEGEKRTQAFMNLVWELPKPNRDFLRELCIMLGHVAEHSDENNMTIKNLAIVFAPNLFRPRGDDLIRSLKDAPHTLTVTRILIEERDVLFKIGEPETVETGNPDNTELMQAKGKSYRSPSIALQEATLEGATSILDLVDEGIIGLHMIEDDATLLLLHEMRCVLRTEGASFGVVADNKLLPPEHISQLLHDVDNFLSEWVQSESRA